MLKLCLVEDEEYALKILEHKIKDLQEDYDIIGTAYNGLDALDLIKGEHPDVVITDIRMPDMDGITLIEKLKEDNLSIMPVILSGYQEFEYAKQAVKLGVEEYLLKPVVPNELRECLKKCQEKINKKKNESNISSLLTGSTSLINNNNKDYIVLYIIFANALSSLDSFIHPSISYIPSQDIENIYLSIFSHSGIVYCFNGICSNEKVLIIQKNSLSENVLINKLIKLQSILFDSYNYPVTIAYQFVTDKKQLRMYISECRKNAMQNIVLGKSRVISDNSNIKNDTNMKEIINSLTILLKQWQIDLTKTVVYQLFNDWKAIDYPLFALQNDMLYIINSLKHNLSVTYTDGNTLYYVENIVSASNTFDELADNFYHLILELFEQNVTYNAPISSPTQLVEQIENYFKRNLSKNITLQMLCDEMNFSKVYLCRVFKKQKDMTPIDYFIQLKIERAKELIIQYPSMPMKDIADSLGFKDVYYFSKVFKRITSQTPSTVRSEHEKRVSN